MKKVIILLLFIIVAIAIVPVFLPKTIHEEAEYIYDANPKKVYDSFNNLKKMSQWFSWDKKDNRTIDFSTPIEGIGASYDWTSDGEFGGSVAITDAKEMQFVGYSLNFKDQEGNTSEAIFQVLDDGKVKVIWTFDSGELSYPFQVYNYLMKGKVKENLERGLKNLDEILKKEAADTNSNSANENEIKISEESAKQLLGVVQTVSVDDDSEYKIAVDESLGLVESYLLDEKGLNREDIGNEVIYFINENKNEITFIVGFFLKDKVAESEDIKYLNVPAYKTLTTITDNDKAAIEKATVSTKEYAKENNFYPAQNHWQVIDGDKVQIYIPVEGR
ncbi:hypothetical protein KRX57_00695 [Weeksellaceae bacterium TAE3-ERU29]|nr:hypothetical protein [Weeksellaceae bacterium TAE3-ERU29]